MSNESYVTQTGDKPYQVSDKPYTKLQSTNLDLLATDGKLDFSSYKVFCYIGSRVTDGNKANVSVAEICGALSLNKSTVGRCIRELEDGMLIKVEGKEGKARVILCSPTYFYNGRYEHKPSITKAWYKMLREERWDSVVKQTNRLLGDAV